MSNTATNLVWFRQDLRVFDNNCLSNAALNCNNLICIFILEDIDSQWSMGAASKWWLYHALNDLARSLEKLGNKLIIKKGDSCKIIEELCLKYNVSKVFYNERFEEYNRLIDNNLDKLLSKHKIQIFKHNDLLLFDIENIKNKEGNRYQTFTSFWKFCQNNLEVDKCLAKPSQLLPAIDSIDSNSIDDLNLMPKIKWYQTIEQNFTPTQEAGLKRFKYFVDYKIKNYKNDRNLPYVDGISKLSPYLHFGQISIKYIFHQVKNKIIEYDLQDNFTQNANCYLSELAWREFAYYNLLHNPHTANWPLREEFNNFPYKLNQDYYSKWCQGLTGYPIVDAGMRELWHTGFMHNRVRMIVASFLCKDLFISWLDGAKWFWDTLLDADLASNTLGWQWTSGCGVDAQPYFRIFNPYLQSKKFDPQGLYIKKWIPELKDLSSDYVHEPHSLLNSKLNYPKPLVIHEEARAQAMQAWRQLKK